MSKRPGSMKGWPAASLLGQLAPQYREELIALGTTRRYRAGATLVSTGGTDRVVYFLLSGCAKVVGHSADGRETLLAVRMRGDVVGEITALYGGERSATVDLVTDAEAVAIGYAEFRSYLTQRPQVAEVLHHVVAEKLRQATGIRTGIGGARVRFQVAEIVYQLARAYGRPGENGAHLVEVPLTQADLGAIVGASKASVERAAAGLRAAKLVRWSRCAFEVADLERLRTFIDQAGDA